MTGWPKGLTKEAAKALSPGERRALWNKPKEVVPDTSQSVERADKAEPASRPKPEARAADSGKKKNWGENWAAEPVNAEESPDRYHIPRDMFPEGLDLQWWTWTIRGQNIKDRAIIAERGAWRPVKQDSFDNWHSRVMGNRFPVDEDGNIVLEGSALYARPMPYSERARERQKQEALEAIALKEQAFKGGDINATGANHPSALATNKISRSMERIEIPKE